MSCVQGADGVKLFIPGPVQVRKEVLQAMAFPMIGHRTAGFSEIYNSAAGNLKKVMMTEDVCLISTSSGSGFMEAAIRNCVKERVLNTVCGAFSDKWHDIALRCGRDAVKLDAGWGSAVKPEMVAEALETGKGKYDAVCVTHNETTTGVTNPLDDIAKVVKKHPDVLLLVDTVSSLGGMKVEAGKLRLDFCLASSQKALGLPPGLAVASVSEDAFARAAAIPGRGYYFDILELRKMHAKGATPYTPSVSHMKALDVQLAYILAEGLEKRFARHAEFGRMTRKWARGMGLPIFAEKGYESDTVTCMVNAIGMDIKAVQKAMASQGYGMDSGYRNLNEKLAAEGKPQTFRIAHMGDLTTGDLREFLDALTETIRKSGAA
jgi:aspartate aminotransferase-like enzyme